MFKKISRTLSIKNENRGVLNYITEHMNKDAPRNRKQTSADEQLSETFSR